MLKKRERNVNKEKVIVRVENREVFKGIANQVRKVSLHTQDAGAKIAQIK